MYKIFSWLVGTLSPQNQKDISQVKKMITDASSLQVLRQKVPLQMWENKELLDLLIKKHLEGAIYKTFLAENIAEMKKEWESVSFLLNLLEHQRSKGLIEDYKADSAEVIEVKLDNDVIIEDIAEPKSVIATELSRQELLGHYLCTTIALVTKRQCDIELPYIDDEDLINCMHSFQKNIIQILLKNKANPNIQIKGSIPLSWVARQGDNESMKLLLTDPRLDPNIKDQNERTPLHYWAVQCRAHEAVKLLLADPRLDPNVKDQNGCTPLHSAWKVKNFWFVKLLLADPRLDPNIKDLNGDTLLHWAVQYRDYDGVKLLLADQRLDPNIKNPNGNTPLHWAVQYRDHESMQLLLADPRLDPNIKNPNGNTPLHFALNTNDDRAISLLIEQGARLDIKNNLGKTSLHNIINLDLDSEQNGSNKLIQILDALTPKALSNIYCALQDLRCDQGKKDQLNKYMLQRNGLNQDLMPKIVQKQINNKFLPSTHKNLFGGKAVTTQCEGKVENENESERLKEIMKEPFFRQSANSFSTLISQIELKDQGDSNAPFNSIFKEHKPPTLYQSSGDSLVGELANLSHDA